VDSIYSIVLKRYKGEEFTMKIGRNAPCPCGSGKKYKKCCLKLEEQRAAEERQQNANEQKLFLTGESGRG
jgi:hypothetical protein